MLLRSSRAQDRPGPSTTRISGERALTRGRAAWCQQRSSPNRGSVGRVGRSGPIPGTRRPWPHSWAMPARGPLCRWKLLSESLDSGAVLIDASLSPRREVAVNRIEERAPAFAGHVPLPRCAVVPDFAAKEVAKAFNEPDFLLRYRNAALNRACAFAFVDSCRPNDIHLRR